MTNLLNAYLEYLETEKKLGEVTRSSYASDLRYLARYIKAQGKSWQNIDEAVVVSCLRQQWKQGVSQNTLKRRWSVYRGFGRYLKKRHINEELVHLGDFPLVAMVSDQEGLDAQEVEHACENLNYLLGYLRDHQGLQQQRDYALLMVMLDTGAGLSEVIRLNVEDINLTERNIAFRKAKGGVRKKPLDDSIPALENYLRNVRPELAAEESKALFVSQKGNRITRQCVWQRLTLNSELAGLNLPITPRLIRYCAMALMHKRGKSIEEIHRTIGYSKKGYTRVVLTRIIDE